MRLRVEESSTTARHNAAGTLARAQALRWLLFAATEIYPIVEINDYPKRFATDPDQIDAMRERAREIWRVRWLVVEANVDGNPYLSRDWFSLTDIYVAVLSRWAQQEQWRPACLPKVERLTAAVAARPAILTARLPPNIVRGSFSDTTDRLLAGLAEARSA